MVCRRPATSRAPARSSNRRPPSKPTENVWIGCVDWADMWATIRLESTPPESSAPTGTSATRWLFTASAIRSRNSSTSLRGERLAVPPVVKRLDAKPVARRKQPPGAWIPYREGKHAAQVVDAEVAPVFVRAQHDFGVALLIESGSELPELAAEIAEVVDLSVEGERRARHARDHRL